MPAKPDDAKPSPPCADERQARLAEALRANLRRRKQARCAPQTDESADESSANRSGSAERFGD